ncbi:hypothetical protein XI08_27080 [Bradyrhizobium sp. CCBAU 11361]|nr:hypothetical protein [Bradyrhizobium sp. CCBAU 11361]
MMRARKATYLERGIAADNVKPADVHMPAFKGGVVARLDRATQYAETFVIEWRSRGVLDAPPSRGMTVEDVAAQRSA